MFPNSPSWRASNQRSSPNQNQRIKRATDIFSNRLCSIINFCPPVASLYFKHSHTDEPQREILRQTSWLHHVGTASPFKSGGVLNSKWTVFSFPSVRSAELLQELCNIDLNNMTKGSKCSLTPQISWIPIQSGICWMCWEKQARLMESPPQGTLRGLGESVGPVKWYISEYNETRII